MKKSFVLLSVLFVVFFLTGCFTTVSIKSLAPSEVNLGGNQVIAVAPASLDAYAHYSRRIPVENDTDVPVPTKLKNLSSSMDSLVASAVTKHLSQSIFEALSEGVYTIVSPEETKRYLKNASMTKSQSQALQEHGITMLLNSSIDYLNFDEHIESRALKTSEGKTYYNYYLIQSARIGVSYRLVDVATGKAVDAHSYSASYPTFQSDRSTLIAQVDENGTLVLAPSWQIDCESMFNDLIDSFKRDIRNRLVPHTVRLSFNLQEGPDKKYAELNKLVEQGYLNIAFDNFKNIYETTGEVSAGYNYAVLYYALGYPEDAIALVQSIYQSTLNPDIGKLLTKMNAAYSANQVAKEQAGL